MWVTYRPSNAAQGKCLHAVGAEFGPVRAPTAACAGQAATRSGRYGTRHRRIRCISVRTVRPLYGLDPSSPSPIPADPANWPPWGTFNRRRQARRRASFRLPAFGGEPAADVAAAARSSSSVNVSTLTPGAAAPLIAATLGRSSNVALPNRWRASHLRRVRLTNRASAASRGRAATQ